MKVSTIADLGQMDDGDQPKAVKAKLKSLQKPRSGESNGREWHFQDFELIDATGSLKGSFSNREPLNPQWVGQILYFEAQKSAKGWSGLYIKDEKFTPKGTDEEVSVRKFKVTATATVMPQEGHAGSDNDGDNAEDEDDIPMGDEEKPGKKVQTEQPTKQVNGDKAKIASRCKEVYYERTSNLGNYESMKVGILLELEPGAKFQDCLDLAKLMVEKNLKPEAPSTTRKGGNVEV